MSMKQNDAVVAAIVAITGYSEESGPCKLTKEQKAQVKLVLYDGFKAGKIALAREPYVTEAEWMNYISGLIDNHVRKDKRLNGGVKYEAKNPGSRSHLADESLKAMFALYNTPGLSDSDKNEIMVEINARKAELAKAKAPTINWDALPEHLKAKFAAK